MPRIPTKWFPRVLKRLRREDGNATIEFVILFPLFMMLFVSAFEIGLVMVRQVMLDRATDLTVRSLRLGKWEIPDGDDEASKAERLDVHEKMKDVICDAAGILPDCRANLMIELSPVSTDTWAPLPDATDCVDKNEEVNPPNTFTNGAQHELMMVRVCALQKPIFPLTGLGAALPRVKNSEHYALISMSAFVNEPS